MIVEVLLALPLNNKTFYYNVNSTDKDKVNVGQLIEVSFRKKDQIGLIINLPKKINFNKPLSNVKLIYEGFFFNDEIIKSILFLSKYTCNPLGKIFKNFISGFHKKLDKNQIINFKNFVKSPSLSIEQKNALSKFNLKNLNEFKVFALSGVTGSGKTRVYMYVIKKKLEQKLQCLITVPEIILTKEWIKEISEDFGIHAEIYHSSIKKSKRKVIWNHIIQGKPILIIGTRSSLFLPFKRLGAIIVDEEHDQSYKQEEKLILNARDFAIVRAKNSNCPIILSSATLSIETIQNCNKGKFTKINITKRINNNPLPGINIIDMRKEKKLISRKLYKQINENLINNHQSMIFINKRGYTSFVICKNCGFIKSCPNCDVSLVLHNFSNKKKSLLLCHHCSYKEIFNNTCLNCKKNKTLQFPGEGIEKIFEEVKSTFPKAKSVFISSDSVKNLSDFNKTLNDIQTNKINIIVGTQILSKGHNFPFLKTVGIINIDNLLNDFDFRSQEKCFQQIIQVSGRAGRKDLVGNVIIQTLQPKNNVLINSQNYSFANFHLEELEKRRRNNHPPFSNFISLILTSTNHENVKKFSFFIVTKLNSHFKAIEVYGPAPAVISMMNKKYRYRILIKTPKKKSIQDKIKNFLTKLKTSSSLKLYIDVDPINFL